MNVNKISVNTNFGVVVTDRAKVLLKRNGATDFEIDCLPCKIPTDATIDADEENKYACIDGKYARFLIEAKHLTMENVDKLCKAYNTEKFFSVLRPKRNNF